MDFRITFFVLASLTSLESVLCTIKRTRSASTFIVGGSPATPNEFPWLVYINFRSNFCGGALINLDLVLTAAHCLLGVDSVKRITIHAGEHDLEKEEGMEQNSTVMAFKCHENYDKIEHYNDLALIRLTKSFTPTTAVKPILLPDSNFNVDPDAGGTGIVAGWGTTAYRNQAGSSILLKVTLPFVPYDVCRRAYSFASVNLTRNQFCAGEMGKDSCLGDSGGPFICSRYPNTVCGIVSFGVDCAKEDFPGVYVNVSSYVDWITQNRNFDKTTLCYNPNPPPNSISPCLDGEVFQTFLVSFTILMMTPLWS